MTIEIWLKSLPAKTEYYKGGNVLRVEDPPPMWIYIIYFPVLCLSPRLIFIISMSPSHHPLGMVVGWTCAPVWWGVIYSTCLTPGYTQQRNIQSSSSSSSLRVSCCQMSFDAGQHLKAGRLLHTHISTGDDECGGRKQQTGRTHACDTRRAAKEERIKKNKEILFFNNINNNIT